MASHRNSLVDMTCKVIPLPPSPQQQKIQFSQILIPTPTPPPTITIETIKQKCGSCQKPVLSTPESLQTGICLSCRRNQSTQNQRAQAQQKTRPTLPQIITPVVITSKYFQQKRTINELYSSASEPQESNKKLKSSPITPTKTFVCNQTTINKDNKNVCPLCKLTPRKKNHIGLCSSCNKYRLNKRKNQCHVCGEFLGFAQEFYLCLCSHIFCQHCINSTNGETPTSVVKCCSQFVKIQVKTTGIDQN